MIQIALLYTIIWMLPILTIVNIIAMYFIIKLAIKHSLKKANDQEDRK